MHAKKGDVRRMAYPRGAKHHGPGAAAYAILVVRLRRRVERDGLVVCAYGDEAYFRYIKDGVDSFLSPEGNCIRGYGAEDYNPDHLNNGKQLLYLYERTGEARYLMAVRLLLGQLHGQPRTKEGGFWHKKIYPE